MRAAVRGRGAGLKILAVTVLTSYDDADAAEAGYALPVAELVAQRAVQAAEVGIDGLVCRRPRRTRSARSSGRTA